ncbi:exopolysaccharide Pel transporter PelG [Effusibacillus consociatus]|uniref:Exopolysaccharide Pel transporter PelG n=1 Tax=Effusibacillus consociatus TaxID=1117041 RepID=A0ABV9PXS1_9BACL
MAGIGFTLQKALGGARLNKKVGVYGAAAFVTAGPWLLTLISLFALLSWGYYFGMTTEQRDLFFATVTYATIGSNLISGTAQFVLTRYLADALYVNSPQRLLSAFTSIFVYSGGAALIGGIVGQWFLPLPFPYRVWTVLLIVILTLLWLLMVLISAAKAYRDIAYGFLIGMAFLFIVATGWGVWIQSGGPVPHPTSILALFAIGQGFTLLWVGSVAIRDFSGRIPVLYNLLPQHRRYPELLWIGLFYALTLWVDNGVYWFSELRVKVADSYPLAPTYDLAKFFTFLSFIPALTAFSVQIETKFYLVYRQFYKSIEQGDTLAQIQVYEEALRTEAKRAVLTIAKIQTVMVVLVWVVAQQLFATYPDVIEILQWTIIGSIPHISWITVFLLLLYFDARKKAMWCIGLGLFVMFLSSFLTEHFDWWTGTGYLMGAVVMLFVSFLFLNRQAEGLLYYAFYGANRSIDNELPPAALPTASQIKRGLPVVREVSPIGQDSGLQTEEKGNPRGRVS